MYYLKKSDLEDATGCLLDFRYGVPLFWKAWSKFQPSGLSRDCGVASLKAIDGRVTPDMRQRVTFARCGRRYHCQKIMSLMPSSRPVNLERDLVEFSKWSNFYIPQTKRHASSSGWTRTVRRNKFNGRNRVINVARMSKKKRIK